MANKTVWLQAGTANVRIGVKQKRISIIVDLKAGLTKRLAKRLKNKSE